MKIKVLVFDEYGRYTVIDDAALGHLQAYQSTQGKVELGPITNKTCTGENEWCVNTFNCQGSSNAFACDNRRTCLTPRPNSIC